MEAANLQDRVSNILLSFGCHTSICLVLMPLDTVLWAKVGWAGASREALETLGARTLGATGAEIIAAHCAAIATGLVDCKETRRLDWFGVCALRSEACRACGELLSLRSMQSFDYIPGSYCLLGAEQGLTLPWTTPSPLVAWVGRLWLWPLVQARQDNA